MDRRDFVKTSALAGGAIATGAYRLEGADSMIRHEGKVVTVNGPIAPSELGFTLPYEHVLVDFIGADKVSPDRYASEEAFAYILPHLAEASSLGCEALLECTPSYNR